MTTLDDRSGTTAELLDACRARVEPALREAVCADARLAGVTSDDRAAAGPRSLAQLVVRRER